MTASPALTVPELSSGLVLPDMLRTTMRRHGAGVAVITTRDTDGPVGFCATSLTSVSLDPPTVSFAVAIGSTSGQAWERTGHGIIHLLRSDQAAVASNFARSGPDKFDAIGWRWGPNAQPLLDHVLAWMLVSTRIRVAVGDHLLIVCDVREVAVPSRAGLDAGPDAGPLIHHNGRFHGLAALPQ